MKTGLYETLERIATTIQSRKGADPATSYVAGLLGVPLGGLVLALVWSYCIQARRRITARTNVVQNGADGLFYACIRLRRPMHAGAQIGFKAWVGSRQSQRA